MQAVDACYRRLFPITHKAGVHHAHHLQKRSLLCAKKLCTHEKMLLAIVFIPILAAMAYVTVQLY
jgi:hypothetical protein